MPEEINRIMTDHCSSLLFCPTSTAVENLQKEGITHTHGNCTVDTPRVFACGDIMYDNSIYFSDYSKENVLIENDLKKDAYLLFTMHRPSNTDEPKRLKNICQMLMRLASAVDARNLHPLEGSSARVVSLSASMVILLDA